MSPLLDPFIRGVTVGALLAIAFAVWRSGVSRHARIATLVGMASIAAWTMTESGEMRNAFGAALPLDVLAMVVGGSFWLFVAALFEDRPISGWTLAPVAVLLVTGVSMNLAPKPVGDVIWVVHNLIGVLLCLHAGFIVARGWRGDLIESRRRLRALVFGVAALFGVAEVAVVMASRLEHSFPWHALSAGGFYGGLALAILALASAALLLQGRSSLYGPSRRPEAGPDTRAEAADRHLLAKLEAFMADGGWKREGLTIGAVAEAVETPEHRLRRLINQKLGHRNFADFVNGHRIEAAKRRLGDPAEARTTVAAIAFDLGYGSLGPFNRAFRAATGASPTEWRRAALAGASPILEEAV
ncbi:AraC family transcriptional regulator [Phenylobacterium sp.]|jgi:AraC-like DNA-binding protein|uniref:helix-turn-helix domain-containing protein n=1 Tax=Phenylobacterium sp. TaxID=1871053 RepID=UPI002F3EBCB9